MGVVKKAMLEEIEHEHLEEEIKEYLLAQGAFDPAVVDTMSISFSSQFSSERP
tara:strand:- start:411 stop:569 length:159 start_codon:yes stop_codon:yes gene_type:complete